MLERQLGMLSAALDTLQQAITKYPGFDKLHMIRGQILESQGETASARSAYAQGCRSCPKSIPLWILSARLEEKAGVIIKARSLLEKARLYNPKDDRLWAESIKIEERTGNAQQAKSVLSRGKRGDESLCQTLTSVSAMQECPTSPILWSTAIFMEAPQQRKGRSVDALKKAGEHPAVIVAVARLFWGERKIEKTRQWMQNAVTADSDWGDVWGWWLKFERQHGEPVRQLSAFAFGTDIGLQERQQLVIDKCVEAQPHHGPVWQSIAKDLKNIGKSTADIVELVMDKLE